MPGPVVLRAGRRVVQRRDRTGIDAGPASRTPKGSRVTDDEMDEERRATDERRGWTEDEAREVVREMDRERAWPREGDR